MLQVVIRFFTLDVITEHPVVYIGLGVVWVALLLSSLLSILSYRISGLAKTLWFLLVLLLPILGLALYALRCLFVADWYFLKPLIAPPATHRG